MEILTPKEKEALLPDLLSKVIKVAGVKGDLDSADFIEKIQLEIASAAKGERSGFMDCVLLKKLKVIFK